MWREKPQFFSLKVNLPATFCASALGSESNRNTELMWHSISYLRGTLCNRLLIDLIHLCDSMLLYLKAIHSFYWSESFRCNV